MKTIVIILTVLIAVNVVYADIDDVRKYKYHYETCAQKFNVPNNEVRVDTTICAAYNDGEILDASGAYKPEVAVKKIKELISDPDKLQQAYEIYYKCDNETVQAEAIGIGKTIRFLQCGLSLISLLDMFD